MNDLTFGSTDGSTRVPVMPHLPLHDATALTRGGNLAQIALVRSIRCASRAPES